MRVFLASLIGSVSADLVGLTAEQSTEINEQLEKSCGKVCVDEWKKMSAKYDGQPVSNAVQSMMGDIEKEADEFKNALSSPSKYSSYLAEGKGMEKAMSMWNPFDTPCYDAASCKIVETLANKSQFGRIATLAIYQALNLPIHIVAVVARVLCGCISVYNQTMCFLGPALPMICEPVMNGANKLFGVSSQIWESAKTMTKVSKVIGQPLIAS